MSIFVVNPRTLIQEVAIKLKEDYPEVTPPPNSRFWKTAFFKELAPINSENFWYIRCASLMRKVKKLGPIGINRLRKIYGGRNRRGTVVSRSARGAGKIIRVALQQLENSNLIIKTEKNGRILSPEGLSLLERTAHSILREKK